MEFVLGVAAGVLLLPWYWISILGLLLLVDVVLVESDEFAWTSASMLGVVGTAAWLGGGINPFMWAWANVGNIFQFFIVFWLAGGLWSIVKWYLFLLKVRDAAKTSEMKERPHTSYASRGRNPQRIMGWIAFWPLSMLGSLFGEVLSRIVKNIYKVLSGLYDSMANKMFADFENR